MMKEHKKIEDMKTIHLVPYSHHDHAWTNTRQWHIWRYIEGFCLVLDLMRENSEYTLTVDNVLHSLEVFERYCPSRIEEFQARVAEGRIEVVNGGMSLARPSLFDGELYIRNIVRGRQELAKRLGAYEIPIFFNADTAVGHSQMPQLLKLCGHEHYRFFRPEGVLDYQNVPRNFIWSGLDGTNIVVSRGVYGGFLFTHWAGMDRENWQQVKQAFIDEDLKDKLPLATTDHLLLNIGCDDVLPMRNLFDEEIDLMGFIKNWNNHERSEMKFSSFSKYHSVIKDKELPIWKELLDPCELSYNAPVRADDSLWRKRTEGERLLVTAEKLLMLLESMGESSDFAPLNHLWQRMMRFAGHAMQWLLREDYEQIVEQADATLAMIREQISIYADRIANLTPRQSKVQYVAINTCSFDRTENVLLHVTSPYHISGLTLKDAQGENLEYQFVNVYNGDKPYKNKDFNEAKVTCNITVPAFGYTCITAEFDGNSIVEKAKRELCNGSDLSFIIDNGIYQAVVTHGVIRKLTKGDGKVLYQSNANNFGAVRLYHTTSTSDWTTHWDDIAVDTFVPEQVCYTERGPIRFSYTSIGKIGQHPAKLETIFVKDSTKITYRLEVDNKGAEGYFAAVFPCAEEPNIIAGIPFGQEPRDTDSIVYSQTTGAMPNDYIYFERGYIGGFYANGFVTYDFKDSRMALLQGNCNVYYRNVRKKEEIEMILMKSLALDRRTQEWVTKVAPTLAGVGVQHFTYEVSLIDEKGGVRAHQLMQAQRYPLQVATRYSYDNMGGKSAASMLCLDGGTLLLSAAYKENGAYYVRLYEADGKDGQCILKTNLPVKKITVTDLCGYPLDGRAQVQLTDTGILISYNKWEIITLRIEE